MKVLHFYCPEGWAYQEGNRFRVYLPDGKDVTLGLVRAWNEWFKKNDLPQNEYDQDLHDWCLLSYDAEDKEGLANAGESFGDSDFCAILETVTGEYRLTVKEGVYPT